MLRAILKAAFVWPIGQLKAGPDWYHGFTCGALGSQAFHPPKLAAAWQRYGAMLRDPCGMPLDGLRCWVHDCGWTPVSGLAAYLVTGRAARLSNTHARVLDRYLEQSLQVLSQGFGGLAIDSEVLAERRRVMRAAAACGSARRTIEALGGGIDDDVDVSTIPLDSESIDFCHSGNALEHYRPETLRVLLRECWRVLCPGGIASHVFDHRDHLHHVDRNWPFLFHELLPGTIYRVLFGHPLLYHNRLRPNDVMQVFEDLGFERVWVRRAGVDFRYRPDEEVLDQPPGLPSWGRALARPLSELDLRTAYAHYVYRKPTSGGGAA